MSKQTGTTEFKKRLAEDNINGIFIFCGEEKFSRDAAVDALLSKFSDDSMSEFNIQTMDEKTLSADLLSDFALSYPVMSDRKLLIIRNSGMLKNSNEKITDFWLDIIKDFPEYLTVVIDEDNIDGRLNITKKLKSTALFIEFAYKTPQEAASWCAGVFKRDGYTISSDDAYYLVDACDEGLYSLKNEIDKLKSKCENTKTVTRTDIDETVKKSLKNRIFAMLDATVEKRAADAYTILSELKIVGESADKIIILLGRQATMLYKAKVLISEGRQGELASTLGVAPFIARKYADMTHTMSISALGRMLKICTEADFDSKSGKMEKWTALEILIGKIADLNN